MAVDIIAGLRGSYAQLIPSIQNRVEREERERLRKKAEEQNRITNIMALGGAVGGGVLGAGGGPMGVAQGAAIGASLGNLAGRAVSGGQAPSVAETVGAGASIYGLMGDQATAGQNAKLNKALTENAIGELRAGVPAGMTPESVAAGESSRRLASTLAPGMGGDVNVAANALQPTESDQRLAELLGPGMSTQAAPTPEQARTLQNIKALQELQSGDLGRVSPQAVAGVVGAMMPKKGDYIPIGPRGLYHPKTGEVILGEAEKKPEQTFEVRVGRGPNAQVVSTAVSLADAQNAVKANPGAVIYKTSTEPSNTGEGTGLWMRFNAYADQRVEEVNQLRQASGQPPLSGLESEAFKKRVVDEMNRQDFQRETKTIDPETMLPATKGALNLVPVEDLVKGAAGGTLPPPENKFTTAKPISPARTPTIERKQLSEAQMKGFTGSSTAMELMGVLSENVGNTGFIIGPAKEWAQRSGFMKPDGTMDFAIAKARMDNIAQEIIKGIPSNFDVQTFQKTLAKIGEDPEANKVAIKQGVRQLARSMSEQIEYARKFNLDLPTQSLETAKAFGVDVDGIMAGTSKQRISFDKPLGAKIDPFTPKTAAEALALAKEKKNSGRWMIWNGQLRPIND